MDAHIETRTGGDDEAFWNAVLQDYTTARDDDRNWVYNIATVLSAAAVVLGGLAAAFSGARDAPDYVLLAAPGLPILIVGFLLFHGTVAVSRAYYIRQLELMLRDRYGVPDGDAVPLGLTHVTQPVSSPHTGLRRNAIVLGLTWSLVIIITVIIAGMYVGEVDNRTAQALGLVVYGIIASVMIPAAFTAIFEARSLWWHLVAYLPNTFSRTRALLLANGGSKSDAGSSALAQAGEGNAFHGDESPLGGGTKPRSGVLSDPA